ncbi:CsiV family protein [Microbulbifer pacificus]|uniref:CsiV family protein n=1 Tax=Microbulbifer pacificus TaxID=407164 RepID=UPI000CF58061|nr:CsiV family protein [Microbulbifer pacificus]
MTFTNHQVTKCLKQLAGAALLTLCAVNTQAAGYAGTQFEIEMVVFARESGMNQSRETWPAAPRLTYSERWVDFNTPSRTDPMVPALQPAPNQLDNKVAALRRDPGYQVLFHKTWRQVLQGERSAPAVLISGGPQNGSHHQLEGSVTLSVARYLHLSTDLWFSEWLPQTATLPAPLSQGSAGLVAPRGIAVPARPRAAVVDAANTATSEEPLNLNRAEPAVFHSNNSFSDRPVAEAAPQATEQLAARVAVLQEERRLRSGELHYIDHPKLGVLVEVRAVTPTAEPEPADEPVEFTP